MQIPQTLTRSEQARVVEPEAFVDKSEIKRVEKYLRDRFKMPAISVHMRPHKDDSAEVNIGDEFIGVIFRDDEDGEVSYAFQMAILDIDLQD
jgi:hypothetical protein